MVAVKNVRVEGVEMYVFSNGRKPRGEGDWMFEVAGETFAPGRMSFSSACKAAKEVAARKGVYSVKVMP